MIISRCWFGYAYELCTHTHTRTAYLCLGSWASLADGGQQLVAILWKRGEEESPSVVKCLFCFSAFVSTTSLFVCFCHWSCNSSVLPVFDWRSPDWMLLKLAWIFPSFHKTQGPCLTHCISQLVSRQSFSRQHSDCVSLCAHPCSMFILSQVCEAHYWYLRQQEGSDHWPMKTWSKVNGLVHLFHLCGTILLLREDKDMVTASPYHVCLKSGSRGDGT